jgi:hypothetical protein
MELTWKDILLSIAIWLHGLFGAAIGGAATTLGNLVLMPDTFNFGDGLPMLGKSAFIGAFVGAVLYLKLSPVPKIKKDIAAKKLAPS